MKKNKKLLSVHLNEFDYNYLKYGARKYNLIGLKSLFKLHQIKTYTKDKVQNKNLDPWVQCVSINTGLSSTTHGILDINNKLPNKFSQIWDILSKKKIKCGVWGPMNGYYRQNKYLKFFFPDPWNFKSRIFPNQLIKFFSLPSYYAQNYTNIDKITLFRLTFKFLLSIFFTNNFFYFLRNFVFYSKILISRGLKNYILFFLLDVISLNIFLTLVKNYKLSYSQIFFNSLAHFQHNNWNDLKYEKDYFYLTDKIIQKILNFTEKEKYSLILFNGFSQKKKQKYILRLKDTRKFLIEIGVKFKNLELDMTHGGYIYFNNKIQMNKSIELLKNFSVFGFNLFSLKILTQDKVFYRININSRNKFTKSSKNISSLIFYDQDLNKDINKNKKTNLNVNKNLFFKHIEFIKSTGIHSQEGVLFFNDNNFISKNIKKIENIKIFNLTKSFFK
jgi:hypothetical protein